MKRKTRLLLESLAVESFDTSPAGPVARGTVRGHDSGEEPNSIVATCDCPPPPPTSPATCVWTCDPMVCTGALSCGGSCVRTCGNTCDFLCEPEDPKP